MSNTSQTGDPLPSSAQVNVADGQAHQYNTQSGDITLNGHSPLRARLGAGVLVLALAQKPPCTQEVCSPARQCSHEPSEYANGAGP